MSHILAQVHLGCDPSIYASCVTGMTGTLHHTQLIGILGWSLVGFLPGLASNGDPPDLYLQGTRDFRCEPWQLALL
jgi:hypothetical protein